ncbi:MAG: Bug family tripartite tricarboxylate transporter substrate binding protein [Xanthobacteraceae bacterium]
MDVHKGCLLAVAIFAALPNSATADSVSDFYEGKQIRFIIRANPGGNYDLYMRLLARHIVRYIPGKPTAVPVNMPGGGGLTALNYTVNVAPHDGTVVTMVTQTTPMDQALGLDKNLKIDMRSMNWIGNMSDENLFLVTVRDSPTKTLQDATKRETPLAATGAGGVEVIVASVLNSMLGTKFKSILGYRSSPEMNVSMQRREAEGRMTTNLRALFGATSGGASAFNILVQTGLKVAPDYPKVPLLRELAKDPEQKVVLDFISRSMSLGRPVATNQKVPAERMAALRRAFDATMKDPQFLSEAKQQGLDISPWTGAELHQVVADIVNTPAAQVDRIRQAIRAGLSSEQRRKVPK